MGDLEQLRVLYEQHCARPFPHSIVDERVSDVFADLVLYGGFVAGLVDSALSGLSVWRDATVYDSELELRLQDLIRDGRGADEARQYLTHLRYLKEMLALIPDSSKRHEPKG